MKRRWNYKLWTGPCGVSEIADKLRTAGLDVILEGTEHVHVSYISPTAEGGAWDLMVDVRRAHNGNDFGLKPVRNRNVVAGRMEKIVMTDPNELTVVEEGPANALDPSVSPEAAGKLTAQALQRGAAIATELKAFILQQRLYTDMGRSRHVHVQAWTTLADFLGFAIQVLQRDSLQLGEDHGFVCDVALVRKRDGVAVHRASGSCWSSETMKGKPRWQSTQAMLSMAQTRGTSKVCQLAFGWILTLAGFNATPTEEMEAETGNPAPPIDLPGSANRPEVSDEVRHLAELAKLAKSHEVTSPWFKEKIEIGKMKGHGFVWEDAIANEPGSGELRSWMHGCLAMQAKDLEETEPDASSDMTRYKPWQLKCAIMLRMHHHWKKKHPMQEEATDE